MPTGNTLLTTDQLLKSLQTSALSEEEKKEFEGLLGRMTEEEKLELQQIIEDANRSKESFESEKNKKLAELNGFTAEKLKNLDREENKHVFNEVEKFDQQQTEKELPSVTETLNEEPVTLQKKEEEKPKKHPHEARNFILILLGLVMVAGALIYGLLTL